MIPEKDTYVRIIFRNSMQAEGYVESWSDKRAVLRSDEGLSLLIIQDPVADIMLIKVFPETEESDETIETPPPFRSTEQVKRREEIDEDFEDVKRETEIDQYLKAKTLLELRKLQMEQDRKIISEQLKDHTPTHSQVKVQYELPGFFKKQGSK